MSHRNDLALTATQTSEFKNLTRGQLDTIKKKLQDGSDQRLQASLSDLRGELDAQASRVTPAQQSVQAIIGEITAPQHGRSEVTLNESQLTAYGAACRSFPAWEHAYTPKMRAKGITPEGDYEARDFIQATAQRDASRLREIFENQPAHYRATLDTTTGAGIVPLAFLNRIQDFRDGVAKLANMVQTLTLPGGTTQVPQESAHITAGVVLENASLQNTTDPTFVSVSLTAAKIGGGTVISNELLEDSPLAVVQIISRQAGEAVGLEIDANIGLDATAFDQSLGDKVATTLPAGTSAMHTDTPADTAAALAQVSQEYWSLPQQYRNDAIWLITETYAQALGELTDDVGRVLFDFQGNPPRALEDAGSSRGGVNSLFGLPVVVSSNLEADDCFIGDFSGYLLGDWKRLTMEVSTDAASLTDQTTFRFRQRVGGLISVGARFNKYDATSGTA